MLVSLSVTVNSNSTLASAARSLTTVLLTVSPPVCRVFVNAASAPAFVIDPLAFSEVVVMPVTAASVTV